jgi:hypothetical protein
MGTRTEIESSSIAKGKESRMKVKGKTPTTRWRKTFSNFFRLTESGDLNKSSDYRHPELT